MKYPGFRAETAEVEIRTRSYTRYQEMRDWCTEQFGKSGGFVDDTWLCREAVAFGYVMFYFEKSKDATFFKLRWSC